MNFLDLLMNIKKENTSLGLVEMNVAGMSLSKILKAGTHKR